MALGEPLTLFLFGFNELEEFCAVLTYVTTVVHRRAHD